MLEKLLRFALNPGRLAFHAWRAWPIGSFKLRLDYDVFPRPHYAYCVYHAARLASLLDIPRISLIEFGVAGGSGLIALEQLAGMVEREFDVEIEIYGFDTATGLPNPVDHRDLPYIWKEGFFRMDATALRAKLTRSELVLGNVSETVPSFFDEHSPAPIAAMFVDLDYYSSTRDALRLLRCDSARMLPRVFCYCDDVLSAESGGIMCDRVGQLLAIREYNAAATDRVLAPIAGMRHSRNIPAAWNDKVYVHHTFDHPLYNTYVHADRDRQLRLDE